MMKSIHATLRRPATRDRLLPALTGIVFMIGHLTDAHAGTIQDWWSDVTLHGQIEGGINANPARPANGNNFGEFIGDHANQAQLDQITMAVARAVDQNAPTYQIGFKVKALYGADARYYEIAGITDRMMSGRYQFIPAEAHLDMHLPWLTRHGLDMQAGILGSPMGVETLDPATRPFYTLAYTTQYSTPFEHVGAMFQWHATDRFDVLFGVDTGNQVSFGRADNNAAAAGYFGLSGTGFADGRLSFIYLGRVGPENAVRALGNRASSAQRFWNDLNATYKISDRLSVTGEFNALHDEGIRADTYSFVSFLSYQVTPSLTFNYRGEIYRDNTGLVVTSFLGNDAYMRATLGKPADTQSAPPTTYGALTLGLTWHPSPGHGVSLFEIRPEIRFDRSLSGTTPFNDLRNAGMFTFGGDAVLGF
ncbi:outer membrane beta-barrel protein [Gluconacetobacter tumulicola]|uniref:Outer membrane beta-barrel protein n=2 Tax=Gluconacetobacter tumulicola TaxID=1017177 RepID=A0A7W4P5H6_9PROT|nr:outer membrane beta-barrel protein [Gluconacetobacter tumulicola]